MADIYREVHGASSTSPNAAGVPLAVASDAGQQRGDVCATSGESSP